MEASAFHWARVSQEAAMTTSFASAFTPTRSFLVFFSVKILVPDTPPGRLNSCRTFSSRARIPSRRRLFS